jgi:hypothetical protein
LCGKRRRRLQTSPAFSTASGRPFAPVTIAGGPEKAYVAWIRRFILFHRKRHPTEMGGAEVTQFLSALAVDRNVAASTQNQA